MMGAGIKREVDCEHLVFEADCVGWLLCYHITLILPLLFVRELRREGERERGRERERETRRGRREGESGWRRRGAGSGSAKSACK